MGGSLLAELLANIRLNMVSRAVSLVLVEADDVSVLPEASSADVHVVFADEALAGGADSAGSAVLTVFAGVSSPLIVGHVWAK